MRVTESELFQGLLFHIFILFEIPDFIFEFWM